MENTVTEKLDTHLIRRWIEALESGKYKQGYTVLRNKNCFCIFGVLCDIYDSSKWVKSTICFKPPFTYFSYDSDFTGDKTEKDNRISSIDAQVNIPIYLSNKIGMSEDDVETFSIMNDSDFGITSFKQLAKELRKFYKTNYNLEF